MDTKAAKPASRRTHRRHDPKFKAQVIEACLQPGVSVAAVALANGLNANYLRRWVKEHRERTAGTESLSASVERAPRLAMVVPVKVETPMVAETGEIRIDIRRSGIAVQLAWPSTRLTELSGLLKELLK
jgi:transposase